MARPQDDIACAAGERYDLSSISADHVDAES
jgi:hypothetical protein